MTPGTYRALSLQQLEVVRCLQCGSTYQKPVGTGVREGNPGCPTCDYLGWIKASPAVGARASRLRRFGEDPLPHRFD